MLMRRRLRLRKIRHFKSELLSAYSYIGAALRFYRARLRFNPFVQLNYLSAKHFKNGKFDMSIDFEPSKRLLASDLFDGRLDKGFVTEVVGDFKGGLRVLTDGRNFLCVYIDENDAVTLMTRYAGNDVDYIIAVIEAAFDLEIYHEYQWEFWGDRRWDGGTWASMPDDEWVASADQPLNTIQVPERQTSNAVAPLVSNHQKQSAA